MTIRRTLPRHAEPHLVWNAFVDLLAMEDYEDLSLLQRRAHLVFWYESEVQNGGHAQYLENRGRARLAETVQALRDLGLAGQADVLTQLGSGAPPEDLDAAFQACTPTVIEALERHLQLHMAEYVTDA